MRGMHFSLVAGMISVAVLASCATVLFGPAAEKPPRVEETAVYKVAEARAADAERENHRLRERLAVVSHENRCLWLKLWVRFFPLQPGAKIPEAEPPFVEVRPEELIPPQNLPIPVRPPAAPDQQ
jgi:hypothetical protein